MFVNKNEKIPLDFVTVVVYNSNDNDEKGKAMKKTELEKTVAYAVGDADLKSSDIPSIDLYMDQIINLVSEKNSEGSEMFADRILTKTMINNYSKDGLIKPIKGKKYSKEHIVQMLLVYSLKNTLSISSIRRVLQGVYGEGFDGKRLAEGYDRYIDLKADNRDRSLEIVNKFIEDNGFDIENDDGFFAFLLGLVSLSADLKNISIALLEERYPDLDEVRRAELEAEKARIKAEKEEKSKSEKAAKQKKKSDEVQ